VRAQVLHRRDACRQRPVGIHKTAWVTSTPDAANLHLQGDAVVRTSALKERGWSRHAIDAAVAAGRLVRVRKGWVATPGADRDLVAAARAGVVLTCVTQARRLGLWVLHDGPPHVAAPAHSGAVRAAPAHVHWAEPAVPRHPDALEDSIENVLVLAAVCQPHERALAIWESALNRSLVDPDALKRLLLPPAARRILDEAEPWSDSGLESFVPPRLRWTRLPVRQQIWIAGRPVDFLIGDRLVLQVDGGTHVGVQREKDIAHDARLTLMGYHVIRVGYGQVVHRWHEVQDLIMRAIAQGLHRAG
jgi:very-short-patch-repair endonuclease